MLDPGVILKADGGQRWAGATRVLYGAEAVARSALTITRSLKEFEVRPALVNGGAGIVSWDPSGQPFSVMGFSVRDGRIVEIDVLADPDRMRKLDLSVLDARGSQHAVRCEG